ncbi:MAG: phosphoglucomutase/phosphomannomutase family protein [Ignavibacteria bacterium]|nr:phosphoglucomutase/phosphomannomutase family protein [Ignavibacteria bacterium]
MAKSTTPKTKTTTTKKATQPAIKFGTDGWRGVIAEDFTFANIEKVALATAEYFSSHPKINNGIVIGYDARFLSKEFAERSALVIANTGIKVKLADKISSTPMVSLLTKYFRAAGGIVITASHNPAKYNGFKIKGEFGGPAHPEMIAEVEKHLAKILSSKSAITYPKSLKQLVDERLIEYIDMSHLYIDDIARKLDVGKISDSGIRILHDAMYGAGMHILNKIVPATEIHATFNPSFGGTHPEPTENNLSELSKKIAKEHFHIGIATDGDADRVGAMDENGNFVDSHKIFSLLLKYFVEEKKWSGEVVKSLSVTNMVDKQCEKYKLKLNTTAVGFKHICKMMTERDVLIGGEESGGLAVKGHLPERDGVYVGLLLAEIMVKRQKKLHELVEELENEFGKHCYKRIDAHVTDEEKKSILERCERKPKFLGDEKVEMIETVDGYKFHVKNGWVLVRASGTEPLIRFYAEADSMERVEKSLDAIRGK